MDWLEFFGGAEFMPHGHCYLWTPSLVTLHVVSDTLITLAYYSIPLSLLYFVRRRRDLGFRSAFLCFAVFILACGTTHALEIWNVWHGHYWLSGAVKAITAMASVFTAILLVRLIPVAMQIPSPAMLRAEIESRKAREKQVFELNQQLESRVAQRTGELNALNVRLQSEISEHQHAQEDRARLASIVESSYDSIIGKTLDDIITSWNPAAERMYGYTAEEALGQTFSLIVPPERKTEEAEMLRRVTNGEQLRHFETVRLHKDGGRLDVSVTVSPIRNLQGEIIGVSKIARDITERKLQEKALRESEARERVRRTELETLIESVPAPIWISRDPECRHITGNRASYEILGIASGLNASSTSDEHNYRRYNILINGIELPPENHPMQRSCREKVSVLNQEVEIQWPDGTTRYMYGSAVPLFDPDGAVRGCLGAFVEITELKRAEQEIKQLNNELETRVRQRTAELEAANRELEAFSYSVSHDLQAPLRAIDGFSRAVMVDYAGQLPEAGQRDLQIIRDGAQKMAALIRDLLMLSRTGRQPLTRQKLDMTGLVQSVWQTVQAQAPERHVEFICDDLPAAEGDEALVRQVWFNLVDNAFKYTRHQEHTRIEISARKEDDGLTFTVRDNGAGFDMRYVHKLFGVFQRLHRVEDYDGTGIGLALVQRIVQRHGGRVWAEGETGRGAVFSFWLPEEKT